MKCKKVRAILLTDLIDREIKDTVKGNIVRHIEQCEGCYDFFRHMCATVVEPFDGIARVSPREDFLERLKRGIAAAEDTGAPEERYYFGRLLDSLADILFPTPVNAVLNAVMCTSVVIAGVMIMNTASSTGNTMFYYVYESALSVKNLFAIM
jgi:hypothetical protein